MSTNISANMRSYFLLNTASVGARKHIATADTRKEIEENQFFRSDRASVVPVATVVGGREGVFAKKNVIVL